MSDFIYPHRWLVPETPMKGYDLLIGNDLMEKTGLVKINYHTRILEFTDLKINVTRAYRLRPQSHEVAISTDGVRF